MGEKELFYLLIAVLGALIGQSIAIAVLCKELCRMYAERSKTTERLLAALEARND